MTTEQMIQKLMEDWKISREEAEEVVATIDKYAKRNEYPFPTQGKTCT